MEHNDTGLFAYRYQNSNSKDGRIEWLKIDFDSEEALYTQFATRSSGGIAMDVLHDGGQPSVGQTACG
ncbi:MAG: hypothetical protein ACLUAR_17670 [Pilosibacter sp.]